MKLLYFALIIMCFSSCTKKDNTDQDDTTSNFYKDVDVNLSIINETGDDLLNPATDSYFSDIQLYYVIDGIKVKAQDYDSQIGGENGILLINETTPYKLRCFTCDNDDDASSDSGGIKTGTHIALLQLNDEITDTITTEWETNVDEYFTVTKVWYNGDLKSINESFTITK